jgi:hypothetical protein
MFRSPPELIVFRFSFLVVSALISERQRHSATASAERPAENLGTAPEQWTIGTLDCDSLRAIAYMAQ